MISSSDIRLYGLLQKVGDIAILGGRILLSNCVRISRMPSKVCTNKSGFICDLSVALRNSEVVKKEASRGNGGTSGLRNIPRLTTRML